MTKKQLIEALQSYDDDMLILIPGYENGFNLTGYITSTHVMKRPRPNWWDGEYLVSTDSPFNTTCYIITPKPQRCIT